MTCRTSFLKVSKRTGRKALLHCALPALTKCTEEVTRPQTLEWKQMGIEIYWFGRQREQCYDALQGRDKRLLVSLGRPVSHREKLRGRPGLWTALLALMYLYTGGSYQNQIH